MSDDCRGAPKEATETSRGKRGEGSSGARLILSTTSNTLCCAANGPREMSELPRCELRGPFTEGDYHGSWIFSGFYSVVLESYTKMQPIKQPGIVHKERNRRRERERANAMKIAGMLARITTSS